MLQPRKTEVYWLDPTPGVAHTLKAIAKGKFRYKSRDIVKWVNAA